MHLQGLFEEPITRVQHFADLHPGQASDVWLVETSKEHLIARTTRMSKEPADEFWWGCHALFGIDPTDVFVMESINQLLSQYSTIPVPKVVRKGWVDEKPFVLVEVLPGQPVRHFSDLPLSGIKELGRGIAAIHQYHRQDCGNFQETKTYPAKAFHQRLTTVLPELVGRFHADNPDIVDTLPYFLKVSAEVASPTNAVPILLDMDPTQFLADGQQITGLIDTEVYAFGPCELDLVAIEYLLDEQRCGAFHQGYVSVGPFPDITRVRQLYRYLNLLLSVQGHVPFTKWMEHPTYFDLS